jgi:hypothetical protein
VVVPWLAAVDTHRLFCIMWPWHGLGLQCSSLASPPVSFAELGEQSAVCCRHQHQAYFRLILLRRLMATWC